MTVNSRQPQSDIYQNKWIPIFGIPIVASLMPLIFFNNQMEMGVPFWYLFSHSILFSTGIWLVNLLEVRKINELFSKPEHQKTRVIAMIVSGFIITFCISRIIRYFLPFIDPQFTAICDSNQKSLNIGTYLMVTMVMLLYESKRNALLYKQVSLEKTQLEKEQSVHMLESLKNQVNPHFLFNSLNTLVALIREDSVKAEEFTRRLSSVYRAILDCQHQDVCPLEKELKLAEHYGWLLQARFGNQLKINLSCSEQFAINRFLPPLTLQLLIENAVKHNITSGQQPLTITVTCDEAHIWIENNLQPKLQDTSGAGIGLSNLEARFKHLTDRPIEIEQTAQRFCVKLPLLCIQEMEA
jgi:sensor histidine kinase YesM